MVGVVVWTLHLSALDLNMQSSISPEVVGSGRRIMACEYSDMWETSHYSCSVYIHSHSLALLSGDVHIALLLFLLA